MFSKFKNKFFDKKDKEENVVENAAENAADNAAENAAENAADNATEKVADNVPEGISENMVTEDAAKDAVSETEMISAETTSEKVVSEKNEEESIEDSIKAISERFAAVTAAPTPKVETKEEVAEKISEATDETNEVAEEISEAIDVTDEVAEEIPEAADKTIEAETEVPAEEAPVEKKGFFKKLVSGLSKTRQNIVSSMDSVFSGFSSIDDDFYEEIEEILIMGDMGVYTTEKIIDDLKDKVKEKKIKKPEECKALLIESIKEQMGTKENDYRFENEKSIVLVIGVNGVGKTTSIGKLAAQLKNNGKKVVMAAADTFRAAAIEQLTEWSKRSGADIIAQQEGADPGAVIYDAIQASKARNADVLLCDTAGRLHNKKNLMAELKKIDRIIEKEYNEVYRENLIVLDSTTGQNALSQAKQFMECTDITGVILTKMDGTAKGGIAVAIQAELGIPVKYVGVGEGIDDLQKFNADDFVDALFDVDISE